MLQLVCLVALVFDKYNLKCLDWLLFPFFEVVLVERMIYTTGHCSFHCLYSETYRNSYYCLDCYVVSCSWCHWSYWSVVRLYALNLDVTVSFLDFYGSVKENNGISDVFVDFK